MRPIRQEKYNHVKADGRLDTDKVPASAQAGVYSWNQKKEPVKMWCNAKNFLGHTFPPPSCPTQVHRAMHPNCRLNPVKP